MAGGEGFYMTLLSDGSMESFPTNTTAQFKTLLPHTMDLTDGEWEVGLTEMMYSANLKNVSDAEAYVDVLIPDPYTKHLQDPNTYKWERFKTENMGKVTMAQCEVLVPWNLTQWDHLFTGGDSLFPFDIIRIHFRPGAYTQPLALINEINEALRRTMWKVWNQIGDVNEEGNNLILVYHPEYDRVEYQFNGRTLRATPMCIRFPTTLAYKLGLDSDKMILGHETMTKWINVNYLGNTTMDVYDNLKAMYVYCDIVDPQVVGTNKLKLLRVVPCTAQYDDRQQARWEPIRAEYLKLSKKYFDTIEVHIMNSLGRPMGFLNGRSLVKLHFRKVY